MKQRLHQYLITCDGCDKSIMVIHAGVCDPQRQTGYPEGWREFPKDEVPGIMYDFCPECVAQWEKGEIR